MSSWTRALAGLITLVFCLLGAAAAAPLNKDVAAASAAYRAGDFTSAGALWQAELEHTQAPAARGALLYNMGNAAFRDGRILEAVARYTGALEGTPRSAALWHNLELARSRAGLDAADRGDLAATTERLFTFLRVPELEALSFGLLALIAVGLLVEAFRGGRGVRALLAAVGVCLVLVLGLRTARVASALTAPAMVVDSSGANLRSEPRADLPTIAHIEPGLLVEQKDSLGDWVRVEADGLDGWIPEGSLLSLDASKLP